MGVPLLLRWVWHRQTAWGELAPIALSIVAAPVLLVTMPNDEQDGMRLIIMTVVATIVSVGATLITAPVDRGVLTRFYLEVRPPGFWGPVAAGVRGGTAESRLALRKGLLATFAASGSVFALIVGLGTALLGSPTPYGTPTWLWTGGLVALGVGLVPVWVWLSREPEAAVALADEER